MRSTRILGKKGSLTVPIQIRRSLGLYDRTAVDIELSKDPGILFVMKSKPHCITCGKVGRNLHKIGNKFICSHCLDEANKNRHSDCELSVKDVVDNYCINQNKIKAIKEENLEYEKFLQNKGMKSITYGNQTVSFSGSDDNTVQVQISYNVKEPSDAGFDAIKRYLNPMTSDLMIHKEVKEKYEMSPQFKKAIILMYTENYCFKDPIRILTDCGYLKEKAEEIFNNWDLVSRGDGLDILIDEKTFGELDRCYNLKLIQDVFPGVITENDIAILLNCLIVSDTIKIKNV